ncbi:STM4014 family protein [bacterium]|nr:STM4014 family protein [bacterium]
MSRLANKRLGLIGNPENRRLQDFARARQQLGFPAPIILSYQQLLSDPTALDRLQVDLLRIDSPGENESVAQGLIALGGGPARAQPAFGQIGYLKEYHRGFCRLLEDMERRAIPCLNAPHEIALMFDKWACHQRFVQHGLARPPAQLAPADFPALLEHMRERGSGRLFFKPLHGSSASGVCALRWMPQRQLLIAPLQIQSGGVLVNSLKVQRYTQLAELEIILGNLLPQGMIAEQWIPKLTLCQGAVDMRVLVVAGQARHRVVRQSRHPMTNLHLGNQRCDEDLVRQAIGPRFEEALRLAERAAACFPQSLYAGVDILLDHGGRPLVGEINAFGDLLPRLTHNGESAYTAIARICDAASAVV